MSDVHSAFDCDFLGSTVSGFKFLLSGTGAGTHSLAAPVGMVHMCGHGWPGSLNQ